MMNVLKRIFAVCLVVVMLVASIPAQALQKKDGQKTDYTAEEMIAESDSFWSSIEKSEDKLKAQKSDTASYMKAAYKLVASKKNVVKQYWEDEDTFTFTLSKGVTCAYDYEQRMIDLECAKKAPYGETLVYDYSSKAAHTTQNKQVVFFGAYYGIQSAFNEYSKKADMQTVANKIGGTLTMYLGYDATPLALKNSVQKDNLAFLCVHGHGEYSNGVSYIKCQGSTGLTSSDLNNKHAISFGSGVYGVDGYYMTDNCTASIDDCFIWFGACESMMTNTLGKPLTDCGASVVLGFSQSVTVVYEHYSWGYFWSKMIKSATVAEAAYAMKNTQYPTLYGIRPSVPANRDPYYTPPAYPVFMSKDDPYPQNPDSVQTVKSTWKYYNSDPLYTVTFKDWDGTILNTQRVYQNEDAKEPAAPERIGYTFTGWDTDYTNITADITVTAKYKADIPEMSLTARDVLPGNTASVSITMSDVSSVESISFSLEYNNSCLQIASFENGNAFEYFSHDESTVSLSRPPVSKGNLLCTVVFSVSDNAAPGDDLAVSLTSVNAVVDGSTVEIASTVATGSIHVAEYVLGDIDRNGEINTIDAMHLLRYLADWGNTIDMRAADINSSGDITIVDALLLLRYLAGDNTAGIF